jgi:hypothetical protein
MKITNKHLETLIGNLNDVICEESLLTREERQLLVNAISTVAGVKGRLEERAPSQEKMKSKVKLPKERVIDPRFPNAGLPWAEADETILHDMIDSLPDDEVTHHVLWLADKLGRTPYSVACKIVQGGRCSLNWRKQFKDITDEIKESGVSINDYIQAGNIR